MLGTIETTLRDDGRSALLAYMFARSAWGRGYATEAGRAVLTYVTAMAPRLVVEAFVDTRNERSIALLERLGFRREDLLRDADRFKGSTSDEYRFRLRPAKDVDGARNR